MYVIISIRVLTNAFIFFSKHIRLLKDTEMRQTNRYKIKNCVPRFTSIEKWLPLNTVFITIRW